MLRDLVHGNLDLLVPQGLKRGCLRPASLNGTFVDGNLEPGQAVELGLADLLRKEAQALARTKDR